MTVADTNVRPAGRSPAANARGTRRWGLARLLLKQLDRLLRKLDLTFLLLLAVAPTPACIIPVGPDWQDPFGAPDAEPQILNPVPFPGDEVTGVTGNPRKFIVFVTDPNVEDSLQVQWWVDWRLFAGSTVPPGSGATRVPQRIEQAVYCSNVDTTKERHNVVVAATDTEFVNDGTHNIFLVTRNGQVDYVTWTLVMMCQPP